ncbi:MAG TPA: IclR family transcriptional regulator C-terminal domain-containing protein [Noviherbaspirillum sp.]|uniref:IclR family transcriptional regulator n=1 Tax=Noviherbaspirillum sp. TaxID=1926288 RepID=UPI002B46CF2F|nr:IclR family transcriptional regulator C-terminal domain-containing protein [Noviherbaspirillum sp.]HJV84695.1 IclR family transcriptional regulator C-terminal domain-containing protein [Noviherbaspirillum sp.]
MVVSNRSLSRGLTILRVFNEIPAPTLTEIATRVGLTKATCLRFLRTLQEEGYLSFNEQTKRYQLRPLILELGYAALSSLSLPMIAEPEMEALAAEVRGSVNLSMLDGDEVVIVGRQVASRETRNLVTMNIHIGTRLPAHCTAMGRVLIATEVEDIPAFVSTMRVTKMTPKTLIHRAHLAHEIQEAGQRGWAVVEEQLGLGYSAIGVTVRTGGSQAFGLAVSVPSKEFTRARLVREVLPLLQAAADRLERAFAHSSPGGVPEIRRELA